ncbi:MAG: hypothetical protein FWE03_00565 [Firmicutes bacterium]|nr:hypothetical protein [Bacillota bacterium]
MRVKKFTTKLAIFIVLAMLVLSLPLMALTPARAQEIPPAFRWHIENIFSDDFNTSGGFPATPAQFTGDFLGNHQGVLGADAGIVAGVIPLNHTYIDYFDEIGLGVHPGFNNPTDIPPHPHGRGIAFPSNNSNVLMINTNNQRTAYGFSTHEFELAPHSFYRFSAFIRTGQFADNQGAAMTLTGLPEPVGIWNIDTVSHLRRIPGTNLPELTLANRFGFENFIIYLATGATSESVALNFSVGDSNGNKFFPSNGFAFFDAVRVDRLSPTTFFDVTRGIDSNFFYTSAQHTANQTNQTHQLFHRASTINGGISSQALNRLALLDMNPNSHLMSVNDVNLGEFSGETRRTAPGWSEYRSNDPYIGTDALVWGIFNAGAPFVGAGAFGLTEHPMTSTGISTHNRNNSILVLSSHAGGTNFNTVSAGIISDPFLIEAGSLYSLSFWFNTQHLDGTATAVISGQSTLSIDNFELTPVPIGNLVTDDNYARYGWQRREFFIQGSLITDIELNLQLWLGRGEKSSGVVMFDEIMLTRLNYSDFNEQSAHGTRVLIDAVAHGGLITNSAFGLVQRDVDNNGNILPLSFPARPASWDFINTNTGGWQGQSDRLINHEHAIHGVIPTHPSHFYRMRDVYRLYPMINRPTPNFDHERYINNNVLLMHSPTNQDFTAFGYRSPSFNVSEGETVRVAVNMSVNALGAGASLVLRGGNRIFASIQNINRTPNNGFMDFAFYIEGDIHTANLTVEIWLGLTDNQNNMSRLAAGTIVVNSISLENEPMTFEHRYNEFNDIRLPTPANFAVYSADAFTFNSFDRHSNSSIRQAFDFNLTEQTPDSITQYGIIANLREGQTQVHNTVISALNRLENRSPTSVILRNVSEGYNRLTSNHSFNLTSNEWYKIEFDMFVYLHGIDNVLDIDLDTISNETERTRLIHERARARATRGAGIHLGQHHFANIRDTVSDFPHYVYEEILNANGQGTGEFEIVKRRIHEFRTFSFYFATGEELENFSWQISMGGVGTEQIAGMVVVNAVRLSNIGQVEFNTIANLQEYEETASDFIFVVDNTSDDDYYDDDGDDNDDNNQGAGFENLGFLIAGILFAVAIFIVLIAVAGKKILAIRNSRRPAKKTPKVVSYDRRHALETEDIANVDDSIDSFDDEANIEEETMIETIIVESDEFDDDVEISQEVPKKERKELDSEFDD